MRNLIGLLLFLYSFIATGQPISVVLPHIAAGGEWKTIVRVYNTQTAEVVANLWFYDQNGYQYPFTVNGTTSSASTAKVLPSAVFDFVVTSSGSVKAGYAVLIIDKALSITLLYVSDSGMEGAVSKGATYTNDFYTEVLPYDNTEGARTGMAVKNFYASTTWPIQARCRAWNGGPIGPTTTVVVPGGQAYGSFDLQSVIPETENQKGLCYFWSGTTAGTTRPPGRYIHGLSMRFKGRSFVPMSF